MKSVFLASGVAAYALFVSFAGEALATPSACTLSGLIEGGGLYDWQNSDVSLGSSTQLPGRSNWTSAFGEAAAGVTCNNMNVQADAALYAFWASGTLPSSPADEDFKMSARQGHIGGAAFLRDPNSYAVGVSGSWISQDYNVTATPDTSFSGGGTSNLWRFGGFGELYASENFTFVGSAHYFTGSVPWGSFLKGVQVDQRGFEFAAIAKFYPTNDISLTARADILKGQLRIANVADHSFDGYALSLEGEYLMPDTQFSMFAGARYADRHIVMFDPNYIDFQDTQAYLGVKYAFGGTPAKSIAARDRSGTYDNTSVFLEKLPNIAGSVDNTLIHALPLPP